MSDPAALARATEKLTRHAFPVTLEPLEPMEDEKVLSRDEARAVVDELAELKAALKEEMAWDMGGVPENEWKRRAEKAEAELGEAHHNIDLLEAQAKIEEGYAATLTKKLREQTEQAAKSAKEAVTVGLFLDQAKHRIEVLERDLREQTERADRAEATAKHYESKLIREGLL